MNVFSFAMDLSAGTFRDIQSFRQIIETSIGGQLIAKIDIAMIDAAEAANHAMANASDAASAAPLDFAFHRIIIDAVSNETLSEIYRMFKPLMIKAIEMGKARDLSAAIEEHRLILQALRDKDALAYAFHAASHARFGMECLSEAAVVAG
ncbi:FCD domain-containing protein [Bosea sp. NBC_00550]|uniref:FCD domain-containing protein n=1 Tax=Bosea sp. NBC_00550 TaxID=2969621 RepID=UPI00222E5D1D|nr:FCD domain-containing protein [Bosea sp. NBC_00550]UZF94982.1 FCD domain-containing protein [Bosea sp. NBC_00550]